MKGTQEAFYLLHITIYMCIHCRRGDGKEYLCRHSTL